VPRQIAVRVTRAGAATARGQNDPRREQRAAEPFSRCPATKLSRRWTGPNWRARNASSRSTTLPRRGTARGGY